MEWWLLPYALVGSVMAVWLGLLVYYKIGAWAEERRNRRTKEAEEQALFAAIAHVALTKTGNIERKLLSSLPKALLREIAFRGLEPRNRDTAADLLFNAVYGDEREQILTEFMQKHPDADVRASAAFETKQPAKLIPLLDDPSPKVRREAIDGLYTHAQYRALVKTRFDRETDPGVRERIVDLGVLNGDQDMLNAVSSNDPSASVRRAARNTLERIREAQNTRERKRADPKYGRCSKCGERDVLESKFLFQDDQTGEWLVRQLEPLCNRCVNLGGYAVARDS